MYEQEREIVGTILALLEDVPQHVKESWLSRRPEIPDKLAERLATSPTPIQAALDFYENVRLAIWDTDREIDNHTSRDESSGDVDALIWLYDQERKLDIIIEGLTAHLENPDNATRS